MANTLAGNNNVNSWIGTQSKVKNLSPIAEIDRVNIYEFENGMDVELTNLGGELTTENIRKAQSKVLKNLKKDPAYYTNQIAEETIKRFGEFGSGKKKQGKYTNKKDAESVKADGGKAKVKPTDAPYGKNEEVKGKYKSSGMSPLKEGIDPDNDKEVRDAMAKHVKTPVKSWDQIVKDLAKDGKIKLTKEVMAEITNMVSEAVLAVGDLNKAKELARTNTDPKTIIKYDDPKNPND